MTPEREGNLELERCLHGLKLSMLIVKLSSINSSSVVNVAKTETEYLMKRIGPLYCVLRAYSLYTKLQ